MEGSLQLNRSVDSKLLDQDTAALRSVSIETEVIEMKLIIKSQFSQPGEGGGKKFFLQRCSTQGPPLILLYTIFDQKVFIYQE